MGKELSLGAVDRDILDSIQMIRNMDLVLKTMGTKCLTTRVNSITVCGMVGESISTARANVCTEGIGSMVSDMVAAGRGQS